MNCVNFILFISIVLNIILFINIKSRDSKVKKIRFYYPTGTDLDRAYIRYHNELNARNDIKLISIKANHHYVHGEHNIVIKYIPLKDNVVIQGYSRGW